MPLVDMKDMLGHAHAHGYAVGAFDLVNLDFLEAILDAAEECRAPVILSLAESHFEYFNFDYLMPAVEAAARAASVPVAIHLDHGASLDSAVRGIRLGCNGVMVDFSHHSLEENTRLTAQVVEMAHACGVPVEGELGYVPGVEGEDAVRHPGEVAYTSVDDALRYVEQTGVDFLAVSIGTVHGRMRGEPHLDIPRLRDIQQALKLPLVIHGGTGLSEAQFEQLIANGVTKINYYTALADAAGHAVHARCRDTGRSITDYLKGVQDEIRSEVVRCIRMWGAAGQADAVLECAMPWRPVDHVILYNVSGVDDQQVGELMARGREVLSGIPGVREVVTGHSVKADAGYRFCWLIRFCHPAVIESYRHHPVHVDYADNWFRPVAGDRISIDYQRVGDT